MTVNDNSEKKLEAAKKIASKSQNKAQYEGIEENIFKFFRWVSSLIDRLFFSRYLGLFALLMACLAYFVATYDSSSNVLSSSKVLSNVSINARYNAET